MAEVVIGHDARSWFMNRFDHGSVYFDEVVMESGDGSSGTFRVRYSYNGGLPGWAELEIRNNSFNCIRYHDFPSTCRQIRK